MRVQLKHLPKGRICIVAPYSSHHPFCTYDSSHAAGPVEIGASRFAFDDADSLDDVVGRVASFAHGAGVVVAAVAAAVARPFDASFADDVMLTGRRTHSDGPLARYKRSQRRCTERERDSERRERRYV